MEEIIRVRGLKKAYGNSVAVNGISFSVCKGQMLALLGPNGAGKSTVVNILCTGLSPDAGEIMIAGMTLGRCNRRIRRKIGIVFQSGVLDDRLTVMENLYIRGKFYRISGKRLLEQIQTIASMTGISDFIDRPYGMLSGGQKRRCDIARALIHAPELLFLDEPTTGLDPDMRNEVWKTVDVIRKSTDMTVFFTTHYMEEASFADQIIIMKDGEIAVTGTPFFLRDRFSGDRLLLYGAGIESAAFLLERNGIPYGKRKDVVEISLSETMQAVPILKLCHGRYDAFEVIKGSMEQAYLQIVEEEKRD